MKKLGFILLLLLSCGQRDLENQIENPFLGEWKLEKISCYINDYLLLEEYLIPEEAEVKLSYIKGNFFYTVKSAGISGYCSMEYQGDYFYQVSSFSNGSVSFYSKITPHSTCSVLLEELETSSLVLVPLYLGSPNLTDLKWQYDREKAELLIPGLAVFKGATTIGEGCMGNCLCLSSYKKVN